MSDGTVAWITVITTVSGGAIAWLIAQINNVRSDLNEAIILQNKYRHDNIDRTMTVISELETRLTHRIDRLENGRRRSIEDG